MTLRAKVEEKLERGFEEYNVPYHMRGGVLRYILDGIPGGSFMTALFANDLLGAFGRADLENQHSMMNWASFIYNSVPADCHGSYEIVQNWKGVKEPSDLPID